MPPKSEEQIYDSPTGWVSRHIKKYVKSNGVKGHRWRGTDTLLLTTRGRKSGKLRRTALIYTEDGSNYVVVASYGGAHHHPAWYVNLRDEPRVTIQVGPEVRQGTARTVRGDERARLWKQMAEVWPDYDKYQKRTEREIPVVVIQPDS